MAIDNNHSGRLSSDHTKKVWPSNWWLKPRALVALLHRYAHFLGRRIILWLIVAAIAGLMLSVAEFAIAASLEVLLKTLGLSKNTASDFFYSSYIDQLTPWQLGLGFCICGIFRGCCMFLSSFGSHIGESLMLARMRQVGLYDLLQDPEKKIPAAATVNFRFGELFPRAASCAAHFAFLVPNFVQIICLATFMFLVDSTLSSISLIGIAIIGIVVISMQNLVKRSSARQLPFLTALAENMKMITSNWLLIRIMRTQQQELASVTHSNIQATIHWLQARGLATLASILPPVFGLFLLGGLIVAQIHRADADGMRFILVLYLLSRLVQTLGSFAHTLGNAVTVMPHFVETEEYFARFLRSDVRDVLTKVDKMPILRHSSHLSTSDKANKLLPIEQRRSHAAPALRVEGLCFAYNDVHAPMITDVNLHLLAGQQLGIVGASGSGKSTLLALILGLLRPARGQVYIDGTSPENYLSGPSVAIGYVGAESFLFAGTIKENLDYGQAHIYSMDDYHKALYQSHFDKVIKQFTAGLEHRLKENAADLSTGEKQRLALARALLRSPRLLILDEFTANLDVKTEREITETLLSLKGQCTCIIVSHRPAVLKNADVIFDLPQNKLTSFVALTEQFAS